MELSSYPSSSLPQPSTLQPASRPRSSVPAGAARRWPRAFVATLLGLLALKLVWVAGLPMSARWARYDDGLLIRQAFQIRQGEWLGPYDLETLMKGPAYPLFIAGCHAASIPLSLAQHLLDAAVCLLGVVAFRPLVRRPGILLLPFALCLFDPFSFRTGALSGVMREGVYPALALLVLVSAAAMVIRRDSPARRLAAWALLLGVALGTFWLTREEGAWLLPSVALLVGAGLALTLRSHPRDLHRRLAVWCLPFALWGAMVLAICALNRHHYGVFAVNEIKLPQFTAAYGALARVGQGWFRPGIVLPRAARLRLYELSPAFRELQPYLEGKPGRLWAGCAPRKKAGQEIYGGWFLWALRDAVTRAGRARSAPESLAYYERLAEEVDASCEQGRIACGPPRASLVPPWNPRYEDSLWPTARRSVNYLVRWRGFCGKVPFSGGTPEQLELFREMTGSTLAPTMGAKVQLRKARGRPVRASAGMVDVATGQPRWAEHAGRTGTRIELLQALGAVFERGTPLLVLASLAAFVLQGLLRLLGRPAPFLLASSAILLAIAVRLGLLVYIDVTSFPAIHTRYMAPLSALLLLFCGLALAGLPQALALERNEGRARSTPRTTPAPAPPRRG